MEAKGQYPVSSSISLHIFILIILYVCMCGHSMCMTSEDDLPELARLVSSFHHGSPRD